AGRESALPFQATERAQAVAREQEALQARVQELSRAVERIARAAQAAGIGDTAFQARLREVQELLRRAVTPELEQRLRELQEALGARGGAPRRPRTWDRRCRRHRRVRKRSASSPACRISSGGNSTPWRRRGAERRWLRSTARSPRPQRWRSASGRCPKRCIAA